jgi:acyl-CoA reductase-like NAD-dependent aldehyde dehydrogenase
VADGSRQDAEKGDCVLPAAPSDEGPWPKLRAQDRAKFLFKLADLNRSKLRRNSAQNRRRKNNGKPLREARF